MQRLDYTVLVPYLQPKYEYVLCICLTEFQKKLYSFYLENFARAGQIGVDGKLEGGKKGGLFYDVQTLSQVWNHPYILLMAKNRRDQKMMDKELDDEEDDAGSLKDFIDDADEESAKSTSSSDDGEEENSDDIECLEGGGDKKVKKTRSNAKDNKLVGGLDEAKKEQLANEKRKESCDLLEMLATNFKRTHVLLHNFSLVESVLGKRPSFGNPGERLQDGPPHGYLERM